MSRLTRHLPAAGSAAAALAWNTINNYNTEYITLDLIIIFKLISDHDGQIVFFGKTSCFKNSSIIRYDVVEFPIYIATSSI